MGQNYSKNSTLNNTIFKHHERKKHPNPLKKKTNFTDMLGSVEISALRSAFDSIAKDQGFVTPPQLEEVLKLAASDKMLILPESCAVYARRLFSVFDTNKDKKVDESEFLAGMAIICAGSIDEKLELTFHAFCDSKNPYITRAGMYSMLKSAYAHAINLIEQESGDQTEQVAVLKRQSASTVRQMVEECFIEVDMDNNQVITFGEFKEWATNDPVICASLGEECENEKTIPMCL